MQFGVLSHKYTTIEDRNDWDTTVRGFMRILYGIDEMLSIESTTEGENIFGLYFPLKTGTNKRLLNSGFKVDHVVGDYVFYAGTLNVKEALKQLDFDDMYDIFEQKYNPYPCQMARYDAFGHALRDGLIDEETYDMARKYYGSLWNYVGD